MAEAKQVPLNGAYYGPPIPPQQTHHRRERGSGCCGPCCLLSTLFKLIVTIIVVLGIATLIFWLIFRPSKMKVYVENATLTEFNLTDNNILRYNLALDVAIRNPNKRIGIYYDRLEARAYYEGERFGYNPLPAFYQGHKNTTNLHPVFSGQIPISLGNSDVVDFNREKGEGFFSIDVKIYARIRFKVGSVKTRRFKPDFECELKVPLTKNGSSSAVRFTGTKCDVDF
ncbi:NDR1/HIN1-like protein 10 [Magnolia sinica]|uniref:NDR1/HIN1-like protein 10 n=1 Tax=Magnolia sinica TaxID=86752 RepID=UPI0026598402|nr:NDR1/HIN1-like protein 10 [Magnolia sinica]